MSDKKTAPEGATETATETVIPPPADGAKELTPRRIVPVGAPVQYVLDRGPRSGEVRAAVVVKVNADWTVNLQVFTDGDGNKVGDMLPALLWVRNARYSDVGAPGSWHEIVG